MLAGALPNTRLETSNNDKTVFRYFDRKVYTNSTGITFESLTEATTSSYSINPCRNFFEDITRKSIKEVWTIFFLERICFFILGFGSLMYCIL